MKKVQFHFLKNKGGGEATRNNEIFGIPNKCFWIINSFVYNNSKLEQSYQILYEKKQFEAFITFFFMIYHNFVMIVLEEFRGWISNRFSFPWWVISNGSILGFVIASKLNILLSFRCIFKEPLKDFNDERNL